MQLKMVEERVVSHDLGEDERRDGTGRTVAWIGGLIVEQGHRNRDPDLLDIAVRPHPRPGYNDVPLDHGGIAYDQPSAGILQRRFSQDRILTAPTDCQREYQRCSRGQRKAGCRTETFHIFSPGLRYNGKTSFPARKPAPGRCRAGEGPASRQGLTGRFF